MDGAAREVGAERAGVRPAWILALLLLATLPKLAIVLAPRDDLYSTVDSASGLPYHGEEIHRGNTAVEILKGPILPLLDYHYAPFFGGSLVVSALAAPWIALLGSSIAVLKSTGLLFNALTVLFLVLSLSRFVGRRAALLAGCLAALPPPGYTVLSITAFGTHVESNAFAMILLYAFLSLCWRRGSARNDRGRAFTAGCVAGFAVYFGYIALLSIAALVLMVGLRDRRCLLRHPTGHVLLGFGVGLLPWLLYNVPRGFPGLSIYGRGLDGAEGGALPSPAASERLLDLCLRALPRSSAFRDLPGLPGDAQGRFYLIGIALAIALALASALRRRRAAELAPYLLLQPMLFLAAYALTDFRVGGKPDVVGSFRYVHVLWPWLWGAAGIGLAELQRSGRAGTVAAWVWAGLLATLALGGEARLLDLDRRGSTLAIPAHSYSAFGRFVLLSFAERPRTLEAAVERAVETRDEEDLDLFLFGMGMQLKENERGRARAGARMQALRERTAVLRARLLPLVPAAQRPYFDPWRKGEPAFGAKDRDGREAFWRWYRARTGEADPGAAEESREAEGC